jgi:hypothetical protein
LTSTPNLPTSIFFFQALRIYSHLQIRPILSRASSTKSTKRKTRRDKSRLPPCTQGQLGATHPRIIKSAKTNHPGQKSRLWLLSKAREQFTKICGFSAVNFGQLAA